MNAAEFISILDQDRDLAGVPIQEIQAVLDKYPYCQPLRFILLKKFFKENHPSKEKQLHLAATYATDRAFLYHYIMESSNGVEAESPTSNPSQEPIDTTDKSVVEEKEESNIGIIPINKSDSKIHSSSGISDNEHEEAEQNSSTPDKTEKGKSKKSDDNKKDIKKEYDDILDEVISDEKIIGDVPTREVDDKGSKKTDKLKSDEKKSDGKAIENKDQESIEEIADLKTGDDASKLESEIKTKLKKSDKSGDLHLSKSKKEEDKLEEDGSIDLTSLPLSKDNQDEEVPLEGDIGFSIPVDLDSESKSKEKGKDEKSAIKNKIDNEDAPLLDISSESISEIDETIEVSDLSTDKEGNIDLTSLNITPEVDLPKKKETPKIKRKNTSKTTKTPGTKKLKDTSHTKKNELADEGTSNEEEDKSDKKKPDNPSLKKKATPKKKLKKDRTDNHITYDSGDNGDNSELSFSEWLLNLNSGTEIQSKPKEIEKPAKIKVANKKKRKKKKKKNKQSRTETFPTSKSLPNQNISQLANDSINLGDEIISETLADLLVAQGKTLEGARMYERLILKFPEKSTYFAVKIEKIKTL